VVRLLFFLLLAPTLAGETWRGRVVAIADGDTITVLRDRVSVKIRLHGIDAPEMGQPFGRRAREFAGDLVAGREVEVTRVDTDRYGRMVALIEVDGRVLNHEMVRAGLAWWYRKYAPRDELLEEFEAAARDARRGLWRDGTPIAPWEWRKTRALVPSHLSPNH
jgi:micrococcal nuclease